MKDFLVGIILYGIIGMLWNAVFAKETKAVEVTAKIISGVVTKVLDGDTLEVSGYKIRLAHIDAPEKNQAYGKEATIFLKSICLGKPVNVMVTTKDKYGRFVGIVECNGIDANRSMVASGLAWHYIKYSNDYSYAQLQEKAKDTGIGLWVSPNAVPPWVFRAK